jgi:hypothetical protein
MAKKKAKGLPAFKSGVEYGDAFMLPASKEMKQAMAKHQQHHYPESRLDGMTVPYSKMDAKHKGDR